MALENRPHEPGPKVAPVIVGVGAPAGQGTITARQAGGLIDMMLAVSPGKGSVKQALENLAKAINLALQSDFIESQLDPVYKAARVRKGAVHILHRDFIGLGDGVFARFGRAAKSFQLSLRGPDPASPEGKALYEHSGGKSKPFGGLINLLGRKMDLLQEYEDQVPTYVEQMLDRLEAARMITGWSRSEWDISTTVIGLDVVLKPLVGEQS
jgi:hypothetical protein